jgi:hypothetical protein
MTRRGENSCTCRDSHSEPSAVQPIVSRYTNCAIPAPTVESELLYNWRFTANQFILAGSPLRLTTSNFIFQRNTSGYSPYVTSSLMRGWVCLLQLFLALVSAVMLGSEFRGTHYNNLLPPIRDSPNPEGQVPYLYPQEAGGPVIPKTLGSLFVASYDPQGLRWRYPTPPPHWK